jgi:molybdate transport system substrate-binding protein
MTRNDVPNHLIVLSTGAYKAALDEILESFTHETLCETKAVYDSATSVAARIEAGAHFDIAISTAGLMATLAAKNVFSGATLPAGRNDVCLAFPAASAPPDIHTTDTLREVLLAAPSISVSDPKYGGGSSKYFFDILESLGIAAAVIPKLVMTAGGQGAVPVGEGRAALGIAQTSEIAMVAGLAAVPLWPGTPGGSVAYALGISARPHPASEALAAFFVGPIGLAIRRRWGLAANQSRE